MLRSIASVGGLTLVSRLLGFLRDLMMAAVLGAGPVADAFFIAFRLPNHFRALFAEGAFNAAFVPLFSAELVQGGKPAAQRFAEQVLAVVLAVQLGLLVLFLAIMPWFITVSAPGFADEPYKFDLAVEFTRITFPYLLFISLVALIGGVLNGLGRFAAAAAAPILLNLCLILAMIGLPPLVPTPGHALAWGVLAAGAAQFLYLVWDSDRAGATLALVRPRLTAGVRRFLRVLGPAALGAGVVQISLFADTLIASLLPTGAVSHLYYADRLNQLPLGVIGIAIGTVLLPEMTRRIRSGEAAAAAERQNRAIELTLLLTLPAAAVFLTVAQPILTVLFQRGAFTAADAAGSARVLMAYAIGLPPFVLIRTLVPGFYAREDTATPVKIALVATAVNVALKLVLMAPLGVAGLALATSAGAWFNAGLLTRTLVRRGHLATDARLRHRVPRLLAATVALAATLTAAGYGLERWLADPRPAVAIATLAVLLTLGMLIWAAICLATGVVSLAELRRVLRRSRPRRGPTPPGPSAP